MLDSSFMGEDSLCSLPVSHQKHIRGCRILGQQEVAHTFLPSQLVALNIGSASGLIEEAGPLVTLESQHFHKLRPEQCSPQDLGSLTWTLTLSEVADLVTDVVHRAYEFYREI